MPLRLHHIEDIPSKMKGVYAFWYRPNGRCIYVGKAEKQSIKTRLKQQWLNSRNPDLKLWIDAFSKSLDICYLSVEDGKIGKVEKKLIQMWYPETNINLKQRG